MKKTFNVFLIICLSVATFFAPVYSASAKTIGSMKAELNAKLKEYQDIKDQQKLTKQEQEKVKKDIAANEKTMASLRNQIQQLEVEISKLNKSIEEKDKQIKEIMNYLQVASGESAYLEYTFGAKDFTDFIYRAAIAEQLSKYNNDLITEYNDQVQKSKNKQTENSNKQNELSKVQQNLISLNAKLGKKITDLGDEMLSQEQEIQLLKMNILDLQVTYNCSDDEEIDACKRRAQLSTYIPPSTGNFKRPINNAMVTGDYGFYDPYHTRNQEPNLPWHAAMDLAGPSGSNIYAAAAGKVVSVEHYACGNNVVYIAHNINGNRYTTGYWHMRSVKVKKDDFVTENSVIGIQGGRSYEDTCSTGEHLDFVVTTGAYKIDYFTNPRSVSVNPRNYIYFPALQNSTWSDSRGVHKYVGVGSSTNWYTR